MYFGKLNAILNLRQTDKALGPKIGGLTQVWYKPFALCLTHTRNEKKRKIQQASDLRIHAGDTLSSDRGFVSATNRK